MNTVELRRNLFLTSDSQELSQTDFLLAVVFMAISSCTHSDGGALLNAASLLRAHFLLANAINDLL